MELVSDLPADSLQSAGQVLTGSSQEDWVLEKAAFCQTAKSS